MAIHDNITNKISFQVPYNTNNIFTQNVLFFSVNVIFDIFSIKWYILFIWVINMFLKKTDIDLNTHSHFYVYWWLLINCLLFVNDYRGNVNLPGYIIKKQRKKKIFNFMMEKFKTFRKFLHDRSMVFKQRFKYFKNEKIDFIKVILKLEYSFYQNIFILFHLIIYS